MDTNKLSAVIEENETFTGTDLDEAKLARLNAMRELGERIAEAERRIDFRSLPVVDVNRHASVRLELPALMFTANKAAIHAMGELFRLADAVTVIAADGEGVRITCDVQNIWKTSVNLPGKNLWHITAVHMKNPAFVYEYTVSADTEADARALSEKRLPEGYAFCGVAPSVTTSGRLSQSPEKA